MFLLLMGGIEKSSNRKYNPYAVAAGTALGLGGLAYGLSKAYKAYDRYKLLKEAKAAMESSSPILQMIPI